MSTPATAMPAAAPPWQPPGTALAAFRPPPRALAAVAAARADAGAARYGYAVGGLGLLVGERVDAEAIEGRAIAPVPRAPAWLRGMMNRRGQVVPVFDLALALGLPDAARGAQPVVIVLGRGADALGVVADARPVALRALAPVPLPDALPAALSGCATRAWMQDGRLWLDCDLPALVAALHGAPAPTAERRP